jgi:hypothetical protein
MGATKEFYWDGQEKPQCILGNTGSQQLLTLIPLCREQLFLGSHIFPLLSVTSTLSWGFLGWLLTQA